MRNMTNVAHYFATICLLLFTAGSSLAEPTTFLEWNFNEQTIPLFYHGPKVDITDVSGNGRDGWIYPDGPVLNEIPGVAHRNDAIVPIHIEVFVDGAVGQPEHPVTEHPGD